MGLYKISYSFVRFILVCPQRLKLNHHSSTNIKLFNVCYYKTPGEFDSQPICLLLLSCFNGTGNKLGLR